MAKKKRPRAKSGAKEGKAEILRQLRAEVQSRKTQEILRTLEIEMRKRGLDFVQQQITTEKKLQTRGQNYSLFVSIALMALAAYAIYLGYFL